MKSFKTLLKEAILGNFEYNVPDAKDKRLFDFYMSTSFVKSAAIKDKSFAARNTEEIDYEIDRIKGKLYPELKRDLIDTVFVCIFHEMRHFLDFCVGSATDYRSTTDLDENGDIKVYQRGNKEIYEDLHPIFKKYIKELLILTDNEGIPEGFKGESGFEATRYFISQFLEKYDLTQSRLIRIIAPNFLNKNWPSQYGGAAWYNICKGWLGLNQAESIDDMMVWIDHIYDLQHNTNTVLDKSPDYAINGGHYWIKRALDFKKHIKDPNELLPFVSSPMAEFAQIYMKSYRGIHTEDSPNFEEAAEAIRLGELGKIEKYMKSGGRIEYKMLEQLIKKYKTDIPEFNQIMSIINAKELPKNSSEELSHAAAILFGREVFQSDELADSYSREANANIDLLINLLVLADDLLSLPLISAGNNHEFRSVKIMLEIIYKRYEELSQKGRQTLNGDLLPYLYGKTLPAEQSAAEYKQSVRFLADLVSTETTEEDTFNYMYAIQIMMSTIAKETNGIADKINYIWSYFGTAHDLNEIINLAHRHNVPSVLEAEFVREYIKTFIKDNATV